MTDMPFRNQRWTPMYNCLKKYLGIHLTRKQKPPIMKTVKHQRKKVKNTERWDDLPGMWIRTVRIVKWLLFQKQTIRALQSPAKSQCHL